MARLNTATIIGNIATEPYVSLTNNTKRTGKLSFRLAVPRPPGMPRKYRRQGDERVEIPDYISVSYIHPDAAVVRAHLRIGSQVLIKGALVSRDDRALTMALGRPIEVMEFHAQGIEYLDNINWEEGRAYAAQKAYAEGSR
ncbi:MAG: single-stranded DNA-binding protein [Chloroflexi bacterium]|nr:single-stranded DNA-binding protein [Chloroflexota bacterium]